MMYLVIYSIIGGFIGYCIAAALLFPLINRVDSWWAIVNNKPLFDEPVEERMERTAELMLESVRESQNRK